MADQQNRRQFASLHSLLVIVVAGVGLFWWPTGSWVAVGLIVGFWIGHIDGRRAAGELVMAWEIGDSE